MINQIERETNDKVIAISAKKGVGIKRLNEKIVNMLEAIKEVLNSKVSKFKETQVSSSIHTEAVYSFGVGIILLPCADMIAINNDSRIEIQLLR